MIVLDDPRHSKLRLLVQRAFTPEDRRGHRARACASGPVSSWPTAAERGRVRLRRRRSPRRSRCRSSATCSACRRPTSSSVFDWTNVILGAGDPDFGGSFEALVNARDVDVRLRPGARPGPPRPPRRGPRVGADAGRRRGPAADAGRVRLVLHPPRRRRQRDDAQRHQLGHEACSPTTPTSGGSGRPTSTGRTPDAIEEIVRWGSPVIHMRRTALEDTRIGDADIAAGDKVVMWYWSANRDETVFDDGHRVRHHAGPTPRPRSATAPADRTSASAPTSPGGRSR